MPKLSGFSPCPYAPAPAAKAQPPCHQDTDMIGRRIFLIAGAAIVTVPGNQSGAADAAEVLETKPANGATVDGAAADYYVRFNQPIDHIHSVLLIKQNGAVVQTLEPRFKTE